MKQPITLLLSLLLSSITAIHAADAPKPNVVYMLADDLGWSDLSVHPGGHPTPASRAFQTGR